MTLRVAALGDSTSCGEGVGLSVPRSRTWPALLARALPDAELLPLAVAGARVRDVRRDQLGTAVRAEPHLATLLIGLNDVSRSGFDLDAVEADLTAVVEGLRRTGATVLLGRLHDPCRHLPLPRGVRAQVAERLAAVNGAVDRSAGPDVLVLDLDRIPGLHLRQAWAVDRVHPVAAAHGLIASAAADVLRRSGIEVDEPHGSPLPQRAPDPVTTLWWAARHGAPWVAAHARDVFVPALSAATR